MNLISFMPHKKHFDFLSKYASLGTIFDVCVCVCVCVYAHVRAMLCLCITYSCKYSKIPVLTLKKVCL